MVCITYIRPILCTLCIVGPTTPGVRAVVALRTPYAHTHNYAPSHAPWCWRSTERVYKNAQCERLTVFRAEVKGNRETKKSLRLKLLKAKTNAKWQIPA